jgi:hypothetical protein
MTENNNTLTKTRINLDAKLDLGLGLSKAEGNLNFLAEQSNSNDSEIGITEGMAIMDALHAVQQARKAWQDILHNEVADRK